jgi:hypothetical protein
MKMMTTSKRRRKSPKRTSAGFAGAMILLRFRKTRKTTMT